MSLRSGFPFSLLTVLCVSDLSSVFLLPSPCEPYVTLFPPLKPQPPPQTPTTPHEAPFFVLSCLTDFYNRRGSVRFLVVVVILNGRLSPSFLPPF